MNYRVDDITPDGVLLEGEHSEVWLRGLVEGLDGLEFQFVSPLEYHIRLTRSGGVIVAEGTIAFTLELSCSRCLENFQRHFRPEFKLTLSPSPSGKFPTETELQKEELDLVFYSGDTIDLGQIIYNQIMLSIPFHPLCRDDCLGLCPQCGINKNQESCACTQEKMIDPRMAALKDFFNKSSKR